MALYSLKSDGNMYFSLHEAPRSDHRVNVCDTMSAGGTHLPQLLSTSTSTGSCINGASTHTINTMNAHTTLQDSPSCDEIMSQLS